MTSGPLDLRLVPAALSAWLFTALGAGWPVGRALGAAALMMLLGGGVALAARWRRRAGSRDRPASVAPVATGWTRAATAALMVGAGALGVVGLRADAIHSGLVPFLADEQAQVTLEAVVASDPVLKEGPFAPYVLVRVTALSVEGRGQRSDLRSPLLVIADASWAELRMGERLVASGRLDVADDPELAAVLLGDPEPRVVASAAWWWSGAGVVRGAINEAVRPVAMPQRALIPALVDGDDGQIPEETADKFRTTGLTHLLAVSGSNLTLVLSFMLLIARWSGVQGRWLAVVGALSLAFFVLVARPDPSVLRAAAMGLVGVAGLTVGGRGRGLRALCVAVMCLVLLDPWLARSVGFLLSTLATAGILLLAASWRDTLARWMPRFIAEALAVPMAAQLVCTPAIAAISGQISLVAVVSNVLVAPAVGPTTVLGLVGGLVTLASEHAGHLVGWLAALPAWWIVTVAHRAAELDGAAMSWPTGTMTLALLIGSCVLAAVVAPLVLARPWLCLALTVVMAVVLARPWGRVAWPPPEWLLVACDVGQGDALVLNAGHGAAVVVDAGPDPRLVDRCLSDLDVSTVALVVLTHFHADHIDGLPGVIHGRQVGGVEVSPVGVPTQGVELVERWAAAADIPVTTASAGESWQVGNLSWQVLAPLSGSIPRSGEAIDDGSTPNNGSIVMRVETAGHILLLTGDAEAEEEDDLLDSGEALDAEVVKVSHHGSANQDPDFYQAVGASVALISVGADNDYGHPSAATLALLKTSSADVFRTDLDGDIAIVETGGSLAVVTERG